MSIKWSAILPDIFAVLGNIGSAAAGNKISAYNTAAQTAVKAAVTKVDGGIDKLQAAFTKWEDSNEVAQEAISGTVTLLRGLGVTVPDLDVVTTHVKAAVADLSGILVPQDTTAQATTTAATPAATA
ncbi:hypothetical protein CFR78_04310 [Komagataeibacter rhaeticus]|uniref:hypothetical protein n=1 Tax=Komagataeibacter rhaeticus TaxID=215221 RepID=UPI0004D346F4|nr:hypothetical protein [Komagataeibacter rhaeticus]KDU96473.1 hypothetical protein GLUCORHAEAF1_01780 [Komagataeibacter rhaeticus AF1]PYD54198.1 hypothetical protein CFR78_04310 [Komagataeibacter rhaeticus]GBQ15200.1 hypothetical protein AA16663_2018 [Komagataeibacter rhaeticus DSM 16663]